MATDIESESLRPVAAWVSPAELAWRKWLLLAAGPAAGLIVLVGVWSIFFSGGRPQPPTPEVEKPPRPSAAVEPAPKVAEPQPPVEADHRWVPNATRLLATVRLSRLTAQRGFDRVLDLVDPVWRPTADAVLGSLALRSKDVRRLDWASTDLAAWPQRSVVVIELSEGYDVGRFERIGEPVALNLRGAGCRRLPKAAWAHPFAVIDGRTIVTGPEDLLRALADRNEFAPQSPSIRRLVKDASSLADIGLQVDLTAARAHRWQLPTALMDVWPEGRLPWHIVWEVPEGLGITLHMGEAVHGEMTLVCEAETAAEQVHAALAKLIPAADTALAAHAESLTRQLQAGRMDAATADQYELLLKGVVAALAAARCEVADETVRVRTDLGQDLPAMAAAALAARPAMLADWLDAARGVDQANHDRLLAGLSGYRRARGQFPAGVVRGSVLPPETRLSWIATMLPYYGLGDWHRRLQFGYSWNSSQNRPITARPLEPVLNPALGPSKTEAGFPVTHYVGVAGVGSDAGSLPRDDCRAGVFGFERSARPEEITDGASNTLAILGVSRHLGAWASGGEPTVRALSQTPYVNGPDGFGSGQPDGMLAGMADGSVRFVSKDVDARVMEQLATIGGGGRVTVAALDAKPPGAVEPKPPDDEPEPDKPIAASPSPDRSHGTQPVGLDKPPAATEGTIEPSGVDVEARLAGRVPAIDFRDVPLARIVDFLADFAAVSITFDPEAMARLGVTPNDPVSVQLTNATVGEILKAAVSRRRLDYVVEGSQVLVTDGPQHRRTLRRIRYSVDDLAGDDPQDLADLIRKLVAPDSWHDCGGRGTIQPDGDGVLVVVQTSPIHHQILTFCEKLRTARGKRLRSKYDPERFTLATHLDRAAAALARPVTANFHQPTALARVLSDLQRIGKVKILIDRLALDAEGTSAEKPCTLKVAGQPLSAALDELLRPVGMAYRVVDAGTLQVTTRKAVTTRLELEFYPAADLLAKRGPAEELAERIKGRLAGDTWVDAGGGGVLHVDRPSGCLIVLQSQPIQMSLEKLLAELRSTTK